MAVQQGYGKMAGTDALVFAYDTGDAVNSYKGEPTENLNSFTLADSGTDGSGQGSVGTRTLISDNHVRIVDVNSNTRQTHLIQGLTGGTTYTISVEFKKLSGTPTFRFQIQAYNGASYLRTIKFTNTAETGIVDKDGWQTASWTFTLEADANAVRIWYQDGADYTTYNHSFELRNPQLEAKSHATPFAGVGGTRSATEGLLDLTATTSIDLSNVSFDSDAMFQFDGTDDRIIFPPGSLPTIGTNDFTLEFVCKNTRTDRYNHFFSVLDQYHISFKSHNPDGLLYVYRTSALSTTSSIPAYIPSRNNYYHIVAKRQGDNMQIYINGESQGLKTGWGDVSIDNNLYNSYIGWGAGTEYSGGHYAIAKIYNKALTDAEVSANFKNYKTRFNIA